MEQLEQIIEEKQDRVKSLENELDLLISYKHKLNKINDNLNVVNDLLNRSKETFSITLDLTYTTPELVFWCPSPQIKLTRDLLNDNKIEILQLLKDFLMKKHAELSKQLDNTIEKHVLK